MGCQLPPRLIRAACEAAPL